MSDDVFHLPALCPNAHLFPSGFALGPDVSGATFVGNRQQCPVCGAMAQVLDGVYETTIGPDGSLLATAKQMRLDQLQRLREVLDEAEAVDRPVEEAIEAVAESEQDSRVKEILLGIANNKYTLMLVRELVALLIRMQTGG